MAATVGSAVKTFRQAKNDNSWLGEQEILGGHHIIIPFYIVEYSEGF